MRSLKEVTDIGVRALVDALGKEDAQRFLAQFRPRDGAPHGDVDADAAELPPMTLEEAHEVIRDMHDPMDQQHML
jgi:hypothetical protein